MTKEQHNNNSVSLARDLSLAAIPFMLNAYKHGLFDIGEMHGSTNFLEKMQRSNYAVIHKDKYSGKEIAVMQLTQKGAIFIENNFLEILTDLSPYYIFPIIRQGDQVELIKDLKNEYDENTGVLRKKIISGPSGSSCLDKGVFTVQSCDSGSICVTDDCFVMYRLRLAGVREHLRLSAVTLKSESDELKSRFGTIRVRSLVEELQDKIHTIRLAELIDELYSLPHTKDRLING